MQWEEPTVHCEWDFMTDRLMIKSRMKRQEAMMILRPQDLVELKNMDPNKVAYELKKIAQALGVRPQAMAAEIKRFMALHKNGVANANYLASQTKLKGTHASATILDDVGDIVIPNNKPLGGHIKSAAGSATAQLLGMSQQQWQDTVLKMQQQLQHQQVHAMKNLLNQSFFSNQYLDEPKPKKEYPRRKSKKAITAYRGWDIGVSLGLTEVRLGAVAHPYIWDSPRQTSDAMPEPGNQNGLHATKHVQAVAQYYAGTLAFGQCELSGRVLHFARGYRAEKAIIKQLVLITPTDIMIDVSRVYSQRGLLRIREAMYHDKYFRADPLGFTIPIDDIAEKLARFYQCDVSIARDRDHFKKETASWT